LNKASKAPRLIPVAKITRPHGVHGAAKVYPYGETMAAQKAGSSVFYRQDPASEPSELTIASLIPQQKLLLIKFEELSSREEVLEIAGGEIFLPEDRLPPPSEGEFYYFQLIGLTVKTVQGRVVGTLQGIMETGGPDIYSIDCDGREVLIPAVDEVVVEIDLEAGAVVIDPPEGLLDDL
jgi:16S rRNA processing protein RimM